MPRTFRPASDVTRRTFLLDVVPAYPVSDLNGFTVVRYVLVDVLNDHVLITFETGTDRLSLAWMWDRHPEFTKAAVLAACAHAPECAIAVGAAIGL